MGEGVGAPDRYIIRPQDRENGWRIASNCVDYLREQCRQLSDESSGLEVTIKPYRKKRSLAQNRLYWWWLKFIADHVNDATGNTFSDEDMHDWFREQFLGSRVIEVDATPVRARKSTTKLNTVQMTEYLEQVDRYCADRLDLVLPHPVELYAEAMGES